MTVHRLHISRCEQTIPARSQRARKNKEEERRGEEEEACGNVDLTCTFSVFFLAISLALGPHN